MRIPLPLRCVPRRDVSAQSAPSLPAETLLDRAVLDGARRGAVRRRRQGSRRAADAAPSRARIARLPRRDRVRDGSREGLRPERRARRNVSRRRHDVVRHAARQPRLARRRRLARRSPAAAAPDHLVRRRAAGRGRQQRERRRHRGARRRRRRHAAQRLRRQGRPRQAGAVRRDAVRLPPAGGRGARRGRPGQLQLEPGERVVARRSGSDPLGPSRRARAARTRSRS